MNHDTDLFFTAPQNQGPDPVLDFSGGSCKEGRLCSQSSSTNYGMSGPEMMILKELSLLVNLKQMLPGTNL